MPGPGGGSRGGGARGGSFGGGRGGSVGGPHGGGRGGFGPGPHMHHGGFWPRRHYGHGGGCLNAIFAPVIITVVIVIMVFSFVGDSIGSIFSGGTISYNEQTFQSYADAEYQKAFGGSSAYEDNILIVLLTNESADDYYYIAWVGDHIERDISYMFGNEQTELGRALNSSINLSGYWYSLDSNLASAVSIMTDNVTALGLESSFSCNESHSASSKLINYTEMTLTDETVNTALEAFTEATGIPISIVVARVDTVFEKSYTNAVIGIIFIVLIIALIIYFISRSKKNRENKDRDAWENDNNDEYTVY